MIQKKVGGAMPRFGFQWEIRVNAILQRLKLDRNMWQALQGFQPAVGLIWDQLIETEKEVK